MDDIFDKESDYPATLPRLAAISILKQIDRLHSQANLSLKLVPVKEEDAGILEGYIEEDRYAELRKYVDWRCF